MAPLSPPGTVRPLPSDSGAGPRICAGSAAGVQSTGLQLSSAIGIAVYGVAFYGAVGGSEQLQPYLDGLEWVMWITLAFAAVQVLLMFGLAARARRVRIETRTRNARASFPDAIGKRPPGRAIVLT